MFLLVDDWGWANLHAHNPTNDEVVTPNLYNFDLWHTSGHAAHYKDNMFCVEVEKQAREFFFFGF